MLVCECFASLKSFASRQTMARSNASKSILHNRRYQLSSFFQYLLKVLLTRKHLRNKIKIFSEDLHRKRLKHYFSVLLQNQDETFEKFYSDRILSESIGKWVCWSDHRLISRKRLFESKQIRKRIYLRQLKNRTQRLDDSNYIHFVAISFHRLYAIRKLFRFWRFRRGKMIVIASKALVFIHQRDKFEDSLIRGKAIFFITRLKNRVNRRKFLLERRLLDYRYLLITRKAFETLLSLAQAQRSKTFYSNVYLSSKFRSRSLKILYFNNWLLKVFRWQKTREFNRNIIPSFRCQVRARIYFGKLKSQIKWKIARKKHYEQEISGWIKTVLNVMRSKIFFINVFKLIRHSMKLSNARQFREFQLCKFYLRNFRRNSYISSAQRKWASAMGTLAARHYKTSCIFRLLSHYFRAFRNFHSKSQELTKALIASRDCYRQWLMRHVLRTLYHFKSFGYNRSITRIKAKLFYEKRLLSVSLQNLVKSASGMMRLYFFPHFLKFFFPTNIN